MAIQNKVSLPVIKRLPKYYRYSRALRADGRDKISSSELAHMMGTTASQVRQDFNCFGGFGQQGIGYKVDVLRAEIGKLLFGDGERLPTILIGAGHLGSAVSSFISPRYQRLPADRRVRHQPRPVRENDVRRTDFAPS